MQTLLFIAACAGIVIAPFLFESYKFYLYTIGEPDFFIFSGARLWFFLASELVLGFAAGRISRLSPFAAAGCVAAAMVFLMLLLYQFCDARQCYYSGPDGASWLRLGVLLFATAATGMLMGADLGESRKRRAALMQCCLAGVSTTNKEAQYGQITFECPSYYYRQGAKQCIPATAINGGNSHWKVLWKWGLPNNSAKVAVQGTNVTVELG